jgi:hypothetical protein
MFIPRVERRIDRRSHQQIKRLAQVLAAVETGEAVPLAEGATDMRAGMKDIVRPDDTGVADDDLDVPVGIAPRNRVTDAGGDVDAVLSIGR